MSKAEAHISPLAAYKKLEADGEIKPDDDQLRILEYFERLFAELKEYPEVSNKSVGLNVKSWRFAQLFRWSGGDKKPPKGLYIYGGVGRGKSMLMDLFYDVAPVKSKKRVHFHEFMLDVHARIERRPD